MDLRTSTKEMKPGEYEKFDDSKSKFSLKEETKENKYSMSKPLSKIRCPSMSNDSSQEKSMDDNIRTTRSRNQTPHSGSGTRKNKRRSKKDQDGRNFRCSHCDKTYLSYPALYTHRKLKHSEKNSESSQAKRPVKPIKMYDPNKHPTSNEFWAAPHRAGGPIDPLTGYYSAVKHECEMDPRSHRFYSFLKVFSILDGFASEDTHTLIPRRDYDNLTTKDKERSMS